MRVIVGSTNTGKVEAARSVFRKAFGAVTVDSVSVHSGVTSQPVGNDCFVGARNRATASLESARASDNRVDYAVGLEGGLIELYETWFGLSVACVVAASGRVSFGTSPLFEMPADVVGEVSRGGEIGDIMIRLSGDSAIRHSKGAVGFLTRGLLTREAAHEAALMAALAPHLSPERYGP